MSKAITLVLILFLNACSSSPEPVPPQTVESINPAAVIEYEMLDREEKKIRKMRHSASSMLNKEFAMMNKKNRVLSGSSENDTRFDKILKSYGSS